MGVAQIGSTAELSTGIPILVTPDMQHSDLAVFFRKPTELKTQDIKVGLSFNL